VEYRHTGEALGGLDDRDIRNAPERSLEIGGPHDQRKRIDALGGRQRHHKDRENETSCERKDSIPAGQKRSQQNHDFGPPAVVSVNRSPSD
jgi:hypothetical protein